MKQQKTFVCQISNHEDEEIQGFCLNTNCKESKPQFCFQCGVDPLMHQTCKKDLKRFNQIQVLIQQFKKELQNLSIEINKAYENIKQKYEKLIKQQEQKVSSLNRIIEQINNLEYQEVKENLMLIKEYYDYLNSNGSQTKQNKYGAELLDANQFIKSLDYCNQTQKQGENKDNLKSNFDYSNQFSNFIFSHILTKQNWAEANDLLEKNIQELQKELSFALFFQSLALVEINGLGKSLIQRDKAKTLNSTLYQDLLKFSEFELQKSPNDIALLIIKCYALQEVEMFQESLEICNKILNKNPNHLHVLSRKCYSLEYMGQHQEAIECIEKAIKINPKYAYGFHLKGYSLTNLKRCQESIIQYQEVIKIDPNYYFAHNNIGHLLNKIEKYDEAIICLNKAIDLYPNHKLAYYNKGNSLYQLNRLDEALLQYEKVITIDPNWFIGYGLKGEILMEQKKYNQAQETYQQALKYCKQQEQEINQLINEVNIQRKKN